jgi:hypothetical protein
MSETVYAEGDLIEAVKGEAVLKGRIRYGYSGLWLDTNSGGLEAGHSVAQLQRGGFTLAVIEKKSEPPLPTEPGVYIGSLMHDLPLWLTDIGQWFTAKARVENPERHAPFTKLEPVAETAKRVLDAVRDHMALGTVIASDVDEVAADFGVTS